MWISLEKQAGIESEESSVADISAALVELQEVNPAQLATQEGHAIEQITERTGTNAERQTMIKNVTLKL